MWGRVIEMMIALWLSLSPYIFRSSSDGAIAWGDTLIAICMVVLSSLSFWKRTRYLYLLNLVVAVGLVGWGRLSDSPPTAAHQNHIVVGLLLMMIAIIPNEASRPPRVWRQPLQEGD